MRISNVVLGLAFAGCLFTIALDWDHIWYFVLQVPDPVNLTGIQGRPFHTVGWFLLQSIVAALVFGHIQSKMDNDKMREENILVFRYKIEPELDRAIKDFKRKRKE